MGEPDPELFEALRALRFELAAAERVPAYVVFADRSLIDMARLKPREEYLPALQAEDADFWKAVRNLPKRQAQVIALHYLEDRPIAEIAQVLGCSQNTVKVHLHKGRDRLARRLDERWEVRQ